MSTLSLTLREPPAQRIDVSPLSPDRLANQSLDQVAAIALGLGNRKVRVDELFALSGAVGDGLEIRNSCDKLDHIGEGMSQGRIIVRGDAGSYAGARMKDGSIEVQGNAGAYAATGMRGGLLHIAGNAGEFLGGAIPGEQRGMRGGMVLVLGNAGDRVADRMRRGTVLIAGDTGDYCGSRMVAGTVAVAGRVGRFPALAMKRGTLLLRHAPEELVPTFNDCGEHPLGYLTVLVRAWRALPGPFATLPESRTRVRRYVGDVANAGLGEILIWI
jgi:formylmethanofuran dehydrogenase subunit C